MALDIIALVFLFLFGLAVGSHVNVIVLRYGFRETGSKRSECAHCGKTINWRDLVPVLSYVALRSRCRSCGSKMSRQYPVVEVALGSLFALTYLVIPPALTIFGFVELAALLVWFSIFVALVTYDIRHTLIPVPFLIALAIISTVYRSTQALTFSSVIPLVDGVVGAFLLFSFFFAIYFLTKGKGMGSGDAYIAFSLGMTLGLIQGIEAAVLGVWAGTIVYILLYLVSRLGALGKIRVTMKTELPFAPWLLIGAMLALFTDLSPFIVGEWIMALWVF